MRTPLIAVVVMVAALVASADIKLVIDPSEVIGRVKPMNAVNNGPQKPRASDQTCGNFESYRQARIPFARTHDSINEATSNGHTVDISAVFPNFEADENDPANYDFAYTDEFLKILLAAGTEPFFRLGQTIENGIKKYHTRPPKDFAKWARICEHVIAHYTEGWADGFTWKITYWELWNEADAQPDADCLKSAQWGGTKAQFFEFYEIAAKHLKARFPNLKIGGPALGFRMDWAADFIQYQHEHATPIDFFSWHTYQGGIQRMRSQSLAIRKLLDDNGYEKTESILDEWNYVKGWTHEFPYSRVAMNSAKGAAFVAAAMSACQDSPIDLLMYYDARSATCYNGLFDFYTFAPRQAYYAFLAWAELRDRGTRVKSVVSGEFASDVVEATAAVGADGKVALLLSRFCDDNNRTAVEKVTIRFFGERRFTGRFTAQLTDANHLGSAYPLTASDDGSLVFALEPNAFIYLAE